jgi:hypothetical protein
MLFRFVLRELVTEVQLPGHRIAGGKPVLDQRPIIIDDEADVDLARTITDIPGLSSTVDLQSKIPIPLWAVETKPLPAHPQSTLSSTSRPSQSRECWHEVS